MLHDEQLVFAWPIDIARAYHTTTPETAAVAVYESQSAVPTDVVRGIVQQEGDWFARQMNVLFPAGAILVVVQYGGLPVSILWAKRAAHVGSWYVPLVESDVVLFGWHTALPHRGKGLIGLALQTAVEHFSPEATRFLADVKSWNAPSIRAMQKVGFQFVTRARPLSKRLVDTGRLTE